MKVYISPETSYGVLRFMGQYLGVWPSTVKKGLLNGDNFSWFCLLNHMIVLFFSMYGLCVNRKNIAAASNLWIEVTGFGEVIAVFIFSKYQKSRLQVCEL